MARECLALIELTPKETMRVRSYPVTGWHITLLEADYYRVCPENEILRECVGTPTNPCPATR